MPGSRVSDTDVQGKWIHHFEEDSGAEMVFRQALHPLPKTRGHRLEFDLREDHSCAYVIAGRDDRTEKQEGSWVLDAGTGQLSMSLSGMGEQRYQVVSIEGEKMVLNSIG